MSDKKVTRRRVIGEVAYRLDRIAAAFPRNIHTMPARVNGKRAAAALRDYAEVLRDLEEHGPQVAWEALQEARDPEEHDND